MDLFGLASLPRSDRRWYEGQTAEYLEWFYNDETDDRFRGVSALLRADDGVREFVCNVTASVEVTDRVEPTVPAVPTPADGDGCDGIDPLVVTFALEMTYSTTGGGLTVEEIAAHPFSKNRFRTKYTNQFLKEDGELEDLKCRPTEAARRVRPHPFPRRRQSRLRVCQPMEDQAPLPRSRPSRFRRCRPMEGRARLPQSPPSRFPGRRPMADRARLPRRRPSRLRGHQRTEACQQRPARLPRRRPRRPAYLPWRRPSRFRCLEWIGDLDRDFIRP